MFVIKSKSAYGQRMSLEGIGKKGNGILVADTHVEPFNSQKIVAAFGPFCLRIVKTVCGLVT